MPEEEAVIEKNKERKKERKKETNKQNGVWQVRINQELLNMCRETDIISEIIKRRLRLLGHVESLPLTTQFFILNEL